MDLVGERTIYYHPYKEQEQDPIQTESLRNGIKNISEYDNSIIKNLAFMEFATINIYSSKNKVEKIEKALGTYLS